MRQEQPRRPQEPIRGGGPAAVMQSAACLNTRAGLVSRDNSNVAARDGTPRVGIFKLNNDGNVSVTEELAGQVVAQYVRVFYFEHDATMAELRNKPDMNSTPVGVGATMATAAKMNSQNKTI
ncbi:hypothetical protein SLA2020_107270 [Shorea laevis]